MSQETQRVIFRKYPDGEIIALFPDMNYESGSTNFGMIESYLHVGQHGDANRGIVIRQTKPAHESEYSDLKQELESLGYSLRVMKK